jgi:aryl-alcohol dehydrogenase-like predicted oxidoreductase
MCAVALGWLLHHPRVDAAIMGPRAIMRLHAALASTTVAISDEDGR